MADRSDLVSLTVTKYVDTTTWPMVKLFGKWRNSPLAIRKLGEGRYALDTMKGYSLVCEFWFVRNK